MVRSSNCSSFGHALELQSLFAGGVGQGGHPPVVGESAAVEDHRGDAGGLGPRGDEVAHAVGRRRRCPPASPERRLRPSRPRPACDRPSSSISWATMCLLERNTARRGRSAVPSPGDGPGRAGGGGAPACGRCGPLLGCLPGLAHDPLAGIADALALVGLGLAQLADVGGDLADLLLVDALDDDPGGATGTSKVTPSGASTLTGWREAEGQLEAPSGPWARPGSRRRRSRAPWRSPSVTPATMLATERPGEAVQGAVLALVVGTLDEQRVAVLAHGDGGGHGRGPARPGVP